MCRRITVFCVVMVLTAAAAAQAQHQPDGRPQLPNRGQMQHPQLPNRGQAQQPQQPQQPQSVDIAGKVEGVTTGGLTVAGENEQSWQVVIPRDAKVHVVGEAAADYLHAGLFVEFEAELNEHGAIQGKIAELKIVTPSADHPAGVFPSGGGGFGGQDGAAAKGAKRGALTAGKYRVLGRLSAARGGKYSVSARGTMPFELAEDAKLLVDVSDWNLAAKGDKITVKGMMMPGRQGFAQAQEVKIELSEPLTSGKKKPPQKPTKKPPIRAKPDAGLPAPAEQH
jgi:hypothetical protein